GELWAVPIRPAPEDDEDDEDDEDEEENDTEGGAEHELVGEELTEPGLVWSTDTTDAGSSTAIHAQDALASGLGSAQTTVSDDAVTEVQCVEPTIGTWFALPGGHDPDGVELDTLSAHVSNPEDFRATVSVDIYTADGPSYSPESRGIALGPGESV